MLRVQNCAKQAEVSNMSPYVRKAS
jgi:hypothetical protein